MTEQELNRDWKRLAKRYINWTTNWNNEDTKWTEEESIKKEFLRLYRADSGFSHTNHKSLRISLRLNLALRVVQPHLFGIDIEL